MEPGVIALAIAFGALMGFGIAMILVAAVVTRFTRPW